MRKTFGQSIVTLAENDDKIVLLTGDYGYGIIDEFKSKFPERSFNLGICEQSMVGISAGLALLGFKPYIYGITPFILERAFEQIKLDIDQQNVNVKIIGYDDYPDLGVTHQALNSRKLSELFVNIDAYFPNSKSEVVDALSDSYISCGPTFINLKKIV